ncbi:hypothetical protein FKW77_001384 [Venturia effusa]|uniref:Poly(A) polymerase n=1 Tax=Venturia effusa TaxID=50376 RepID=A0A517LPM1_9PEZI|nr:hypothetical protein FKW77_001384 [Venturia effusa]
MSGAAPKQWGTTPPISVELPTSDEIKLNDALMEELKARNNFEAPEATNRRQEVLRHFQRVTEAFVKHVAEKRNLAPSVVQNGGGKVATFGSYRLGVFGPGSDIDTLVVGPKFVTRDDFFMYFPEMLEKMSPDGAVEESTPVQDAYVPIIKMAYQGIQIDLIYVHLSSTSVSPTVELTDNTLLRGLDDTDLRSINGVRVTDEILQLVPNTKAFRHALRAVKLWANQRAIYSNITGFPGGVAWAMMVARVCQLYPMAVGSVLIGKFFHLIWTWPWPRPVQLKTYEKGTIEAKEWNPKLYGNDRRHIMPVITPAFPSMCATNNITTSTKAVIMRELARASALMTEIFAKKKSWKDLFEKHTFFTKDYKYYLSVNCASRSKEAQQVWSGHVQSKVRRLVSNIENSDTGVSIAHPYVKGFQRIHKCRTEEEYDQILHGELKYQIAETTTEDSGLAAVLADQEGDDAGAQSKASQPELDAEGNMIIHTTTYYVGLELGETDGEKKKRLDISFPVADFKRLCTDWAQYDANMNGLCTIHTRSHDLPLDVFEPGEKRPDKTKKAKSKAAKQTGDSNGFATPNGVNGDTISNLKRGLDPQGAEMSEAKRRQSQGK